MSMKVVAMLIIGLISSQLLAQSEDEIKRSLKLVEDTIITSDSYQLHIQKVVRNPYQRHYSEGGKDYKRYGGLRLTQLLKTIAREGDLRVEILSMPKNPSVALKITWKEGELAQHLPAIFTDLSKHYQFTIVETKTKVQSTELFVENGTLLKTHLGKPLKPGVLNSAKKRKGNTLLQSYSMEDLVDWVETIDSNKILLTDNELNDLRFNFSFSETSPSAIYKKLSDVYGIGHRQKSIEMSVLKVSHQP